MAGDPEGAFETAQAETLVISPQDFGFPFFAVAIIGVQGAVIAAGMAPEFLFARLGFAIAGQFDAAAAGTGSGLCYHAAHFTQNS